jgi:Zn-dependent peptidase ImmA (M78 family)
MSVSPYPGTNAQIEDIASRCRAKVEYPDQENSSGLLLRRLVTETGGTIVVVEDPSDHEVNGGSLEIRQKRDYKIYLSPFTTPLRDNFTIAHEFGHYLLHFFLAEEAPATPIWFARYGSSPIEWQANRFAAAFLMPQEKFRSEFARTNGKLSLLSGLFDVSRPAVEVRAKSLGLVEC